MSDYLYSGLSVVAKHTPDYSVETDGYGNKERVELPGTITFGVEVEGVFVPLLQRKAAGLLKDIERAKSASTAQPPSNG